MKTISCTTFSTRLVAVASGPGRYAGVHAVVRAAEGPGCVVELELCVLAPASREQGTRTTSGAASVVASEIEDMADGGGAAGGGQGNGGAFACVAWRAVGQAAGAEIDYAASENRAVRTCAGSVAGACAGLVAAQYAGLPAPAKTDFVGTCEGSAVAAEAALGATAVVSDRAVGAPLHRSKRLHGSVLPLYLSPHPIECWPLLASDPH
jgi:hypothetical protein